MRQKTILIVEDDEMTRSSLASVLESEAVDIASAASMKEAESLLMRQTFDLAIVDLSLTGRVGRQGLELISRIKAQRPETQVVLFTGYGSPEIEREARRRGAVDFWEKTVPVPTLVEKVRALGIPAGHEGGTEWQ